jgi:hypothetical protein
MLNLKPVLEFSFFINQERSSVFFVAQIKTEAFKRGDSLDLMAAKSL